jgi:hypothetical protein
MWNRWTMMCLRQTPQTSNVTMLRLREPKKERLMACFARPPLVSRAHGNLSTPTLMFD